MPVWRSYRPTKEATNPSPGWLPLPRITLSFRLRLSLGPLFATTLSPVHDPSRKGSAYSRDHHCHHLACDSLAFCGQIVALQRPQVATADTHQSPRQLESMAGGSRPVPCLPVRYTREPTREDDQLQESLVFACVQRFLVRCSCRDGLRYVQARRSHGENPTAGTGSNERPGFRAQVITPTRPSHRPQELPTSWICRLLAC
jgi:hypothetical protein